MGQHLLWVLEGSVSSYEQGEDWFESVPFPPTLIADFYFSLFNSGSKSNLFGIKNILEGICYLPCPPPPNLRL